LNYRLQITSKIPAAMSNPEYAVQAASLALSSDIVRFFEEFYIITDNPAEQENYVDQYTPDAVFIRSGAEPTRGAAGTLDFHYAHPIY
jgi:hypothetical protein